MAAAKQGDRYRVTARIGGDGGAIQPGREATVAAVVPAAEPGAGSDREDSVLLTVHEHTVSYDTPSGDPEMVPADRAFSVPAEEFPGEQWEKITDAG